MFNKCIVGKKYDMVEKTEQTNQGMYRYSLSSYILFFFVFSLTGWIWEVLLHIYLDHTLINRGVLYGPWLPIYGFGGIGILFFLRRFAGKPFQLFFMIMLTAGTLEFLTGSILWKLYQMRWWDYSDSLIHLKGFVCLEGLLLFGTGGLVIFYLAAPRLNEQFQKLPKSFRRILCLCLLLFFLMDTVFSLLHPNAGFGVTRPML